MKFLNWGHIDRLYKRYPDLTPCQEDIGSSLELLIECFEDGNKILVCGNGGSASDSEHIVGELMKGFLLGRTLNDEIRMKIEAVAGAEAGYIVDNLQSGLPAISLVSQTSLISAFANDKAADLSFAQQVLAYGKVGDVLLAISTSGNSKNVIYAAQVAKAIGMKVISLTGATGGRLNSISDYTIKAPSNETFIIQEYHLPIYHALCAEIEEHFYGIKKG